MENLGPAGAPCPFKFNFDPATFKAGDMVSYRIPDRFDDFPFVGIIVEVHDDHLLLTPNDPLHPDQRLRSTRDSRPVVHSSALL